MDYTEQYSEQDFITAIKDLLRSEGHLDKIQAQMRSKVIEAIKHKQEGLTPNGKNTQPPSPSEEVLLINEIIREYLEWNGYLYTASVLASEAGMPKEKSSRAELCSNVGVRDDESSIALPLLSNIIAAYTERIKRKISKSKRDG
ncbi:hypothetical protein JYU34_006954 [Plutella xylostella]|uniref:Uncharacterized protein n=2 Tax=Plutella xylostella TaxID=51655 RepID=A0ABQ7QTD9_PLUXY|nr:centrosomal protein 20 [Plutella xylostella]KAG7308271.1 hypothetical protein JYU34_006954 [Plutella xylostella]CAG9134120.1 unnamed protein product [Plutella xylostella]